MSVNRSPVEIYSVVKIRKIMLGCFLIFFYEASGASGCPLPRSANVTTAIAIKTPIADPNAAIDASAIC